MIKGSPRETPIKASFTKPDKKLVIKRSNKAIIKLKSNWRKKDKRRYLERCFEWRVEPYMAIGSSHIAENIPVINRNIENALAYAPYFSGVNIRANNKLRIKLVPEKIA